MSDQIAILLIEDDKRCASILTAMLKRCVAPGVVVQVVDSAPGAIELIRGREFDYEFVISDYDLTVGTGADVLEFIRQERPKMLPRFLFVSGNVTVDFDKLHRHHLDKPLSLSMLHSKILEMETEEIAQLPKS